MAVLNVHERRLPVPESGLAPLLDGLSSPDDPLWPSDRGLWPEMVFDGPLGVGATGGHGPVRYTVVGYAPGHWVRFRFSGPKGFHGFHEYTVHPTDDPSCAVLRHTLAMRVRGSARLTWPFVFRCLHDALLEDSLDRAEEACSGTVARPARWSPYVRLLRRFIPE